MAFLFYMLTAVVGSFIFSLEIQEKDPWAPFDPDADANNGHNFLAVFYYYVERYNMYGEEVMMNDAASLFKVDPVATLASCLHTYVGNRG